MTSAYIIIGIFVALSLAGLVMLAIAAYDQLDDPADTDTETEQNTDDNGKE